MRLKRRLRLLAHALRGPGPGPTAATVTPARAAESEERRGFNPLDLFKPKPR